MGYSGGWVDAVRRPRPAAPERARGQPADAQEPPNVLYEPDLRSMPAEAEVRILMREYDVPEAKARLMVALERGEIDGDTFEVATDEPGHA